MLHSRFFTIVRKTINTNTFYTLENTSKLNLRQHNVRANTFHPHQNYVLIFKRFESKGNISKQTNDQLDSDVEDYLNTDKSKTLTVLLPSLRMDVVAKAAFKLSRTRMEKEFYKSNVRINGKKCLKKSMQIEPGDEIDLVLRRCSTNPKHLIVNRCTLLRATADPDRDMIEAKILENKSLLIEEYEEQWHGGQ